MQHPIGAHALLADGRTAALVDPDGNVAWLCWPRVDSTPCLLSLLDEQRGGTWSVRPQSPAARVMARAYVPGTLVLRTVWRDGAAELTVEDGLAWEDPPRLIRRLSARGTVNALVRIQLVTGAGRASGPTSIEGDTLALQAGDGQPLWLHLPGARWASGTDAVATTVLALDDGETATMVLGGAKVTSATPPLDVTVAHFAAVLPAAVDLRPSELSTRVLGESSVRALAQQSAAVLTGLRQRGGGIVAAPTTSLPQWPGSGRTWDYRYSWLRDTALAGTAMLHAGLVDDAIGLRDFIGAATATMPPAVLRRVDGTPPPAEHRLEHLAGYRGARPVRIGNAAADQPQLDVAGEVLEFAAQLAGRGVLEGELRAGAVNIADWTAAHWGEPDHGIWEIRGSPRHYTHSRVMAWSGLRLAAELADAGVLAGDEAGWTAAAAAIRGAVLGDGGGALRLHAGGGGPDAALAQAALVGFLAADDPRLRATLDGIVAELDRGGLVDRHLASADSRADPCAPFVFPTFWLAAALDRCGCDGARHLAAAAASAGPLGLFGEVADPVGLTPLGNYPQVQSHAALLLAVLDPSSA